MDSTIHDKANIQINSLCNTGDPTLVLDASLSLIRLSEYLFKIFFFKEYL